MSKPPHHHLASLWGRKFHTQINSLIMTLGTVGLGVCVLVLVSDFSC
ncbi:hypothetical protein [Acaryochloris marina]|nr:hypothetical protein [Acaryochloris marina]QUY40330.1 hypothetical protein I1H34_00540 [Acaryochloris marina S15]